MGKQESMRPHPAKPQAPKLAPALFVRKKRKGNGWIVETVAVSDEVPRIEAHEWDLLPQTERRLLTLAGKTERDLNG